MLCSKCGSTVNTHDKFCSNCGTKVGLPENKSSSYQSKSPKVKNRGKTKSALQEQQVLSIAAIIVLAALVYLFYANLTVSAISSQYLNQVPSITGSKQSMLQIPILIRNKLNTPLGGLYVQASTDMGSVSGCTTRADGECNLSFTPPFTSSSSYAAIEVNANGVKQIISVRIIPDPTAKLELKSQYSTLPADGTSVTSISVMAEDLNKSPVPDGTEMDFSLNSQGTGGSLSANSCKTTDGNCQITYTAPTAPGNTTVQASSYGAANSLQLDIQALPPSAIVLTLPVTSLNGDGHTTTTVTAKVTNKLGKPVPDSHITFNADKGMVGQNCKADSSGSCSVIYTTPNSAGTAVISAQADDNQVSSSISITLMPISNIRASFYATPGLGNPIVPAFALNHGYFKDNIATVNITNTGSGAFSGTVELSIPGWSDTISQRINVEPGSTINISLNPNLNSQAFSNLQERPADYQLKILDSNGQNVYENTYPTNITSFNTMNWFDPNYGNKYNQANNIIAAWIQPNAPGIHQLLSQAASRTPENSMLGYSGTYSSGCGATGSSPCSQGETTYLQLKAIYDQLQSKGMHYVNAPQDFSGAQTVYTPAQSLADGGANCIDGTLVFASAVSATGMIPVLALVPGHSFLCVADSPNGTDIHCIETTMIGSGSTFSQAVEQAASEFTQYKNSGELALVDINQVLSSGIKSLPS